LAAQAHPKFNNENAVMNQQEDISVQKLEIRKDLCQGEEINCKQLKYKILWAAFANPKFNNENAVTDH